MCYLEGFDRISLICIRNRFSSSVSISIWNITSSQKLYSMVLVYLINFRFGHYYLKYCFHFHYHLDHCRHHHLEDNLTKTILQWLRLSFRIHVDFLDKVVQLHYLRDYLDLVRLIVTEWMSKLQKHHMLDSIDFVRYLNRFL